MVIKKYQLKKTLYSTCMQHEIPQSLLVFAVSLTPETANPLKDLKKNIII